MKITTAALLLSVAACPQSIGPDERLSELEQCFEAASKFQGISQVMILPGMSKPYFSQDDLMRISRETEDASKNLRNSAFREIAEIRMTNGDERSEVMSYYDEALAGTIAATTESFEQLDSAQDFDLEWERLRSEMNDYCTAVEGTQS